MKSVSVLLFTAGLASALVVPAHVPQRRSLAVIGGAAPLGAPVPVAEVPAPAPVGKEEKGPKGPKEAEAEQPPAAPPAGEEPPPPPAGEAPPPPPAANATAPPELVAPPEATPEETISSAVTPEPTPAETTTEATPEATPAESTTEAAPEATPAESTTEAAPEATVTPTPGDENGNGVPDAEEGVARPGDDGKGRDDRNRGGNGRDDRDRGRDDDRRDQQLQLDLAKQIQLTLNKLNVGGVLDVKALAGAGVAQSVSLLVQVQQIQVLQQLQLVTREQAVVILGGGVNELAKGRVEGKGRGKKNDKRSLIHF